ncbi:hypothetical protein [Alteromonas sp. S167]|uniref:hypothetical protein n=1 Tax=Alteromonas sp. S167 TaxID=3117402 RepID=UPI002FE1DF06
MEIIKLLGNFLKSELLNDLFESYDVDVIYEYDRLNENAPDSYSASIDSLGLEFSFDSEQVLKTIFIQNRAHVNGVKIFHSVEDAKSFSNNNSLSFEQGTSKFLGNEREWVKVFFTGHSIHYEFQNATLQLIALEHGGA